KTITIRAANITPSMMITELMNSSKILDTTLNTLANQVQPTSTRFAPNLESIQNALKYDKKLHYPSISELEKAAGTVISKQYGTKNTQDPKEQAVLLGIASTIMPVLLTKYPDFLAVDSTGHRNCLNFLNTAFMVRSDEPCGRVVATFVSDKETIPIIDLMFESVNISVFSYRFLLDKIIILAVLKFIQYSVKNGVQLNPKWLAMDKWDPYLAAARKHFPYTQVILCDWHEADALKEWFTRNLNDQWLRDRVFYQFRFVKWSRDQEEFNQRKTTLIDTKNLQAALGLLI
ncbi:2900_t:CDS:2, partial [Dentiscutata heterogama]